MWAACDLAHYIIYTKMGVNASEMAVNNSVFAVPIQLPSLYYKTVPPNTKGFPNTEIYLPEDTYQHHHSAAMAMPMTTLNMLHSNALKATTSSTAVTGKRSSNDVLISSTIHQQTHSTSMVSLFIIYLKLCSMLLFWFGFDSRTFPMTKRKMEHRSLNECDHLL